MLATSFLTDVYDLLIYLARSNGAEFAGPRGWKVAPLLWAISVTYQTHFLLPSLYPRHSMVRWRICTCLTLRLTTVPRLGEELDFFCCVPDFLGWILCVPFCCRLAGALSDLVPFVTTIDDRPC